MFCKQTHSLGFEKFGIPLMDLGSLKMKPYMIILKVGAKAIVWFSKVRFFNLDETIHDHNALQEPLQFFTKKFQPILEGYVFHPYELAKVTSNFFYENKQQKKEKEKVQKQKISLPSKP